MMLLSIPLENKLPTKDHSRPLPGGKYEPGLEQTSGESSGVEYNMQLFEVNRNALIRFYLLGTEPKTL